MPDESAPVLPPEVVAALVKGGAPTQPAAPVAPLHLWYTKLDVYESDKRLKIRHRSNPVKLVEGANPQFADWVAVIIVGVPNLDENGDIVNPPGEIEIPLEATTVEEAFAQCTNANLQKWAQLWVHTRIEALQKSAHYKRNRSRIAVPGRMPGG